MVHNGASLMNHENYQPLSSPLRDCVVIMMGVGIDGTDSQAP
jgi:hypothetical protein